MASGGELRSLEEALALIRELREEVDRLTDFLDNGAVGLHWVDRDGTIVWANRTELTLLGYEYDDYVGRHICEFHADQAAITDILDRLSRHETLHDHPASLRAKDGSIKHVVITSNVHWENEQFVHTRCFTRDITGMKATEDALRASEKRRRLAMQAAQIGTWEYELATGAIVWTGVESIHGLPDGSFGGTFEAYLEDVHPEDRAHVLTSISTAIQAGTPLEMEYRIVRPDGETRWVRGQGQADFGPSGQPARMVGICMDIHAQRLAFDAEKKQRTLAEDANRLKDEFLATVSHELRTPLNAIMGWAEMLLRGHLRPERVNHALVTIAANAKRQSLLIEDLLDVSRIISGKVRLELADTDLEEVIRSAIEVTAPAADAKGVTVAVDAPPALAPVLADGTRLNQVVWNLLSNAVKFTPAGGCVGVAVTRTDAAITIIVRDTGIGIARDFLPFVFAPFRQADATYTRAFGGLGLGLAIARHVVELHGGTIAASSPGLGLGATFTVTLPFRLAAAGVPSERRRSLDERERPPRAIATPRLAGVRVLVIDDEQDARDLLNEFLASCGADVKVVASTTEADALLQTWAPTVMLVDLALADEDGVSFYERLRAGRAPGVGVIPAVALTAHATPADLERTRRAGFALHLRKPVELDTIAKVVASISEQSAREQVVS
ncbi:MAG TPA: ATP-binding protein [Vicinamibacterales bacterium]|nr:ATP-binding protein [Vicinamibacterales bacterium]